MEKRFSNFFPKAAITAAAFLPTGEIESLDARPIPVLTTDTKEELKREKSKWEIEMENNFSSIDYNLLAEHWRGEVIPDKEKMKEEYTKACENNYLNLKKARFATDKDEKNFYSIFDNNNFKRIQNIGRKVYEKTGVPENILYAIGLIESGFNPKAVGNGENFGAMQLNFETAKKQARKLGIKMDKPEDLFDVEDSLMIAASYLKYLHIKFGTWDLAVAAYNGGEGRMETLIMSRFPEIDTGAKSRGMKAHHRNKILQLKSELAENNLNQIGQKNRILAEIKRNRAGYRLHDRHEKEMTKNLPQNLVKHGVSSFTLYSDLFSLGHSDWSERTAPRMIKYSLMVPKIIEKIEEKK